MSYWHYSKCNWLLIAIRVSLWDHPFSTYVKFSQKLTFLTHVGAYQGVRNVSFVGKFCVRTKYMTSWPLVFPLLRDSNLVATALVVVSEIRKIKTLASKCTIDVKLRPLTVLICSWQSPLQQNPRYFCKK